MIGSNFAGSNCKLIVCHTTRMEQVKDADRVCVLTINALSYEMAQCYHTF